KLAIMMSTFALAQRLRGSGVVAHVVHPGAVATGLIRESGLIGIAWRLMAPFMRTEEQGADSPLDAALAPEWANITGAYVKDRAAVRPNRFSSAKSTPRRASWPCRVSKLAWTDAAHKLLDRAVFRRPRRDALRLA